MPKKFWNPDKPSTRRRSSLKHIRADQRKREHNLARKSALRTTLKKTRTAIEAGDAQQAQELYRQAVSQLDRAAQKGIIKKGMADRRKSRLALAINTMTA